MILDNILPGDIYLKSHELHFDSDVSRVCMLIKINDKNDISAYDVLQNLFPDKNKDFIININDTDIALVKEIKPSIDEKDRTSWPTPLWTPSPASSTPTAAWASAPLSTTSRTWPLL